VRRLTWLRNFGVVSAAVLTLSACARSTEAQAAADLADTVKIDGYRKIHDRQKGASTELYFVGPPGVDISQVFSARDWSPEPPPSDLPEVGAFKMVADSTIASGGLQCVVVVSTLRQGFESVAVYLNDEERGDLADGRLVYVKVNTYCAAPP